MFIIEKNDVAGTALRNSRVMMVFCHSVSGGGGGGRGNDNDDDGKGIDDKDLDDERS
jgi:hypothetical protein